MALFDKKEPANTAVSEAAEYKRKIQELEYSRREKMFQIGELFYAKNTAEQVAGTEYEKLVSEAAAILKEKDLQEKRMLAAQGQRKCEACGNILVLDSAFCNKCGKKLEPLFAEETQKRNVCPKCGQSCVEGATFCTSCGEKLV